MERWNIEQLAQRVEHALARVPYGEQSSGRVRSVPDQRTIRYYTTLGLLDRPAEMRGRTAYYERRHLLQLLAIKRLQLEGQRLAEVQARLSGATTKHLEKLAELPPDAEHVPEPTAAEAVSLADESPAERAAFWAAPVACADPVPPVQTVPAVHLRVAPGVTLLLEGDAALRVQDKLSQLQPLLEQLAQSLKDDQDQPPNDERFV